MLIHPSHFPPNRGDLTHACTARHKVIIKVKGRKLQVKGYVKYLQTTLHNRLRLYTRQMR